jgi:hypothetical protein
MFVLSVGGNDKARRRVKTTRRGRVSSLFLVFGLAIILGTAPASGFGVYGGVDLPIGEVADTLDNGCDEPEEAACESKKAMLGVSAVRSLVAKSPWMRIKPAHFRPFFGGGRQILPPSNAPPGASC